uniref:DNA transfer protein n=1 Tax=viral metagenome TaxID=1070528 RepID=A0A6H1ZKV5_9ZZZZ
MAISTGAGLALGGAAGLLGGVLGSNAQSSAAKSAANAATSAAQGSAAVQKYMFDTAMQQQAPYNELGLSGIEAFKSIDPTSSASEYATMLKDYPGLSLPSLSLDSFNFAFNPNDPTYQYRQKEMQKTIDAAAAARGNYNSRPVINALAEGNIALTADESEKQFSRALSGYNTNISTLLSQYGADYGKATDTYNAGYGKLTDLYNMNLNLGTTEYNKALDAIKIGQGAASSSGTAALATGQGLANTYGQLGSNLAQSALLSGQATSDMWSGIGGTAMNTALINALMKNNNTGNGMAWMT